jgi:hypothetical protein
MNFLASATVGVEFELDPLAHPETKMHAIRNKLIDLMCFS